MALSFTFWTSACLTSSLFWFLCSCFVGIGSAAASVCSELEPRNPKHSGRNNMRQAGLFPSSLLPPSWSF